MLALLAGPVGAAVAQAAGYAGQALAGKYPPGLCVGLAGLCAWCEAGGVPALSAAPWRSPGIWPAWPAARPQRAQAGAGGGIADQHRRNGQRWEPGHPAIRATLRGILAAHGQPSRPAAALTSAEVKRLLAGCGTDLAGMRDKALLLVGFAGALRRSELVAIDREQCASPPTG